MLERTKLVIHFGWKRGIDWEAREPLKALGDLKHCFDATEAAALVGVKLHDWGCFKHNDKDYILFRYEPHAGLEDQAMLALAAYESQSLVVTV